MTVLTPELVGSMMLVVPPRDLSWTTTSLGPVVLDYLTYMRDRRMAAKTLRNRTNTLATMCELLDGYSLADLSGKSGRLVLDEVLVRRAWRDVKASSLDTYISTLKSFFAWAYDEELILHDPAKRIDRPKKRERQYSLFTVEEERELFAAQPFARDRVALMLHFEFAMRSTDLRLLQLRDVDLALRAVRLRNGKGGTDRTLSFRTPDVFDTVSDYLTVSRRGAPEEHLLYPMQSFTAGHYTHGLVVPAEDKLGEPYREPCYDTDTSGRTVGNGKWTEYTSARKLDPFSESGFRSWWARCLERAGLPHRRPHDARHTTGTRLVKSGKNFRTVSKFLRHASLNTTELYIHLNELELMRDELWGDE